MRVAEYWVEKGIDGWRLDCPQDIDVPGFWRNARETPQINPDCYLLGEIWTDASAGWTHEVDGVTNYPLMSAFHRFVRRRPVAQGTSAGRPPDAGFWMRMGSLPKSIC